MLSVFCLTCYLLGFSFAALAVDPGVTNSTRCDPPDGAVLLSASGGQEPYTFTVDTVGSQGTPTFTGLAAGQYTYTVADGSGASLTGSFNIYGPVLPSAEFTYSNVTCNSFRDGVINFTNPVGSSPFSYSPDGGVYQDSPSLTNLPPGYYERVSIKDSLGCVNSYGLSIYSPPPLELSCEPVLTPTCATGDGAMRMVATGGTPPYTYSVYNTTYVAATDFNVSPGPYQCYVRDNNFCIHKSNSTMPAGTIVIHVTETIQDVTDCANPDGKITLTPSGGSGPYQFLLPTGDVWSAPMPYITVQNVAPGYFGYWVQDSNNCKFTYTAIIPTVPGLLRAEAAVYFIMCASDGNTGVISVNASCGAPPYLYSIDNGQTYYKNSSFHGLSDQVTYIVVVKDLANATYNASAQYIKRPPALNIEIFDQQNQNCTSLGSFGVRASGGSSDSGDYSFNFEGTVIKKLNTTHINTTAGSHTISVSDDLGCSNSTTFSIGGSARCCPFGYNPINGTCADINECLINNGGCDEIVHCQNTPGNRTCGDCPPGYIGSGYFFCNTTCGDGVCNGLENCINCFRDCKSPTCQICGDGYCDASIKEDCTSCFEDCGACNKKCPENCNGHGTCANGVCICTGTWTDPTCGTGGIFTLHPKPHRPH